MLSDKMHFHHRSYNLKNPIHETEHGTPLTPQSMRRLSAFQGLPKVKEDAELFATDDDEVSGIRNGPKVHEVVPGKRGGPDRSAHLLSPPDQYNRNITLDQDRDVTFNTFYHPSKPRTYSTLTAPSVRSALDELDSSIQAHSAHSAHSASAASGSSTASRTHSGFVYDRTLIERTTSDEIDEADSNHNHNKEWMTESDNFPDNTVKKYGAPLPKVVPLNRTRKFYFFCLGFSMVILFFAFFFSPEKLQESLKDNVLPKTALSILLPAYITMLVSYVAHAGKIPSRVVGIAALVLLFLLAVITTVLIACDVTVANTVWYFILIILGAGTGVYLIVLYTMASLFPGGDSVRMINWGAGFAFLLPAVAEVLYIILGEFIDWDPDVAYRIKSAVVFGIAALFITIATMGLYTLTKSEVYNLFRGRYMYSSQRVSLDLRKGRLVHWRDTWGFLGLQFLTAAITMYVLVGANAVAMATDEIRPPASFYNGFWRAYHGSLLIVAFLLGGFLGMCLVSPCSSRVRIDSTCAIVSLFLPSLLRVGLVAAFYIYTQEPYFTANCAFTLILYLVTGLSEVLVQTSLDSYCHMLCGYEPIKLISCKMAQVCLMTRLAGAALGVALSFIPL